MTLLEKAKLHGVNNVVTKPIDPETLELVLAWYNSEITYSQVLTALFPEQRKKTVQSGRAYTVLSTVLRNAVFQKKIEIKSL